MAVYECFVTVTTTTIIIRAVRALEGWKGTKPCRFSRMFKFDEVEPSRFNPHGRCPLSPSRLPAPPGSLCPPPLSAENWDTLGLLEGGTRSSEEDVSETH